ncbi:membrane protein [Streptomyces aculeolatus]
MRRPFARLSGRGTPAAARGREPDRTAADGAAYVLRPAVVLARGTGRLTAAARRRWSAMPKERRGPTAFLAGACLLLVYLMPYVPLAAAVALGAAALWAGRDGAGARAAEDEDAAGRRQERLAALYEALVPYFSSPDDPHPLYAHEGDTEQVFGDAEFDGDDRLTALRLRYPPYFRDGEPEARARIEQLLYAKCGRGREYLFDWHEDDNRLDLAVLDPLPTDIGAQPYVTAQGESVLGFTDAEGVRRTLPVRTEDGDRDEPPVLWRTGPRSTEPHLLVLGQPGTGTTTLLRSLAVQALPHGQVLVVDGGATGEFGFLAGRPGVLAVESTVAGALALLRWAAEETERRLLRPAAAGDAAADGDRAAGPRPLWIVVDRPAALSHLAAVGGLADPQGLLEVPLRHGRAANVTVVVADQFDCTALLGAAVRDHTRARVVLGPASAAQVASVLGAPPHTTPVYDVPPGRGYVRLGQGPVHRLQVPATPDPHHRETPDALRRAVLELLTASPAGGSAAGAEAARAGG